MPHISSDDVRDLIIDRLVSGVYPIGAKLPPSRDLAEEIGAHRNTIIKAYRALADMGLVSLQQGRGTFVTALLNRTPDVSLTGQLEEQVRALIGKARRFGLSESAVRTLMEQTITDVYAPSAFQAAFVECNSEDIAAAIETIKCATGIELQPLPLQTLRTDPEACVSGVHLICTTLFHVKEVNRLVASTGTSFDVVGIYTQPDEEALRRITQIEPDCTLGVVASDVEGAQRFLNQVSAYTSASFRTLLSPSDEEIIRFADEVDVIVSSRSQVSRLRNLPLSVSVIELPFHVTQQSVTYLVDRLTEHLETRKN